MWEACGLGPGSMEAPVGGADVEVTGFHVAEPFCPELGQAVEALLRGLRAVLLDIHAGGELGGAGSLTEVIARAVVTRKKVKGPAGVLGVLDMEATTEVDIRAVLQDAGAE